MNEKYTFDEVFTKDLTVVVNVINNRAITPETVIDEIEAKCGVGAVMACVPKSGTSYEVVLKERSYVGDLSDDFSIGGRSFQVKELTSRIKVVSIIHLSMYVSEEEIIDRFQKIGVEIVSEIKKRKMSSKSTVFDGTRVFRARLPPTLASIPYSMKFSVDEKDTAYYRVIHNDQRKVCSGCFSPEHIYKDCPNFKCYTCGKQGHIGRNCNAKRCYDCGHRSSACDCKKRKRYYGDGFGNPPKRHANNSDNPEKTTQKLLSLSMINGELIAKIKLVRKKDRIVKVWMNKMIMKIVKLVKIQEVTQTKQHKMLVKTVPEFRMMIKRLIIVNTVLNLNVRKNKMGVMKLMRSVEKMNQKL